MQPTCLPGCSMALYSGSTLHSRPLPSHSVLCGLMSSIHTCLSAFLFVCPTILVLLQGLEWLHKRGRAFCDLKPDNIRVQMGQQPGTFAHVTLVDLGGSVKFKGEQPCWACIYSLRLHMAAFILLRPATKRHSQLGMSFCSVSVCPHFLCMCGGIYICLHISCTNLVKHALCHLSHESCARCWPALLSTWCSLHVLLPVAHLM